MTADYAVAWLEAENHNQWRLFRGEGEKEEKVSEHESESESFPESLDRLSKVLPLLQPGNYVLKAWSGKGRQAAQSLFRFDVKRSIVPASNHSPNNSSAMSLEDIFTKARTEALDQLKFEHWKADISKRVEALETNLAELTKSVMEFHDDDEENNDNAFTRVSDMAEKIPKIANGIQAMGGLFKRAI